MNPRLRTAFRLAPALWLAALFVATARPGWAAPPAPAPGAPVFFAAGLSDEQLVTLSATLAAADREPARGAA